MSLAKAKTAAAEAEAAAKRRKAKKRAERRQRAAEEALRRKKAEQESRRAAAAEAKRKEEEAKAAAMRRQPAVAAEERATLERKNGFVQAVSEELTAYHSVQSPVDDVQIGVEGLQLGDDRSVVRKLLAEIGLELREGIFAAVQRFRKTSWKMLVLSDRVLDCRPQFFAGTRTAEIRSGLREVLLESSEPQELVASLSLLYATLPSLSDTFCVTSSGSTLFHARVVFGFGVEPSARVEALQDVPSGAFSAWRSRFASHRRQIDPELPVDAPPYVRLPTSAVLHCVLFSFTQVHPRTQASAGGLYAPFLDISKVKSRKPPTRRRRLSSSGNVRRKLLTPKNSPARGAALTPASPAKKEEGENPAKAEVVQLMRTLVGLWRLYPTADDSSPIASLVQEAVNRLAELIEESASLVVVHFGLVWSIVSQLRVVPSTLHFSNRLLTAMLRSPLFVRRMVSLKYSDVLITEILMGAQQDAAAAAELAFLVAAHTNDGPGSSARFGRSELFGLVLQVLAPTAPPEVLSFTTNFLQFLLTTFKAPRPVAAALLGRVSPLLRHAEEKVRGDAVSAYLKLLSLFSPMESECYVSILPEPTLEMMKVELARRKTAGV